MEAEEAEEVELTAAGSRREKQSLTLTCSK